MWILHIILNVWAIWFKTLTWSRLRRFNCIEKCSFYTFCAHSTISWPWLQTVECARQLVAELHQNIVFPSICICKYMYLITQQYLYFKGLDLQYIIDGRKIPPCPKDIVVIEKVAINYLYETMMAPCMTVSFLIFSFVT